VRIAGPPEVSRDIAAALERRQLRCRKVVLVSPLKERKGVRFAYRADTDDGCTVKLRHFGAADAARAHLELRAGLEDAFAPAVGRSGAVLFEAWIDGVALVNLDPEARAEEAGALLGRLHAAPLPTEVAATCDTERWRAGAESDVAILRRASTLTSREASILLTALERRDPARGRMALLHKDFCAENMLIDASGRLRVIDNEQLEIGPAGFDLGRTFHRWPMSDSAWLRFLNAYRASSHAEPEATGFWRIVAALVGARVFFERAPERLDATLALLRRFVAGNDLEPAPTALTA
jgi:aminoglycoside phosphotransferase (APT) family kinase protein